ncbi:MAG: hypothetical protein WA667_16705 [Candidatus Nitrosopolaris sp.]
MTSTVTNIVKSARDLSKDDTWFHDPEGRYILFRGVNFASKNMVRHNRQGVQASELTVEDFVFSADGGFLFGAGYAIKTEP